MKPEQACPYYDKRIRWAHRGSFDMPITDWADREAQRVYRKRVQCPVCGRRMKPKIVFCDDGCCVYPIVPPHKKKGWWKKGRPNIGKESKGFFRRAGTVRR